MSVDRRAATQNVAYPTIEHHPVTKRTEAPIHTTTRMPLETPGGVRAAMEGHRSGGAADRTQQHRQSQSPGQ